MTKPPTPPVKRIGLAGLGLMGRGIATCLLAHGLEVVAYNRTASRARTALRRIEENGRGLVERKLLGESALRGWPERLTVTRSVADLADCPFVIETVMEDLALKRRLYDELEAVVSRRTVIASNTSGLPVVLLQEGRRHPERFLVMHWGEPAWITRFLEIVPGGRTSAAALRLTHRLGLALGKAPTVLKFDIRGFLSNRMMYAMMREACHLVESGVADVEMVDRSFRNDIGWWATLAGPFRWMDLTGIPAYAAVMKGLFPELCNAGKLPDIMRKVLAGGARGISNAKGFYKYTKGKARKMEKAWVRFNYDIRELVAKYERQFEL